MPLHVCMYVFYTRAGCFLGFDLRGVKLKVRVRPRMSGVAVSADYSQTTTA